MRARVSSRSTAASGTARSSAATEASRDMVALRSAALLVVLLFFGLLCRRLADDHRQPLAVGRVRGPGVGPRFVLAGEPLRSVFGVRVGRKQLDRGTGPGLRGAEQHPLAV